MLCSSIALDFCGGNLIRQRWPIQMWDVISSCWKSATQRSILMSPVKGWVMQSKAS